MLINYKISSRINNYINTSNYILFKLIEQQFHNNKIQQNKNKKYWGVFLTYAYQWVQFDGIHGPYL